MGENIISLLFCLNYGLAAYGWGRLFCRVTGQDSWSGAYTTAMGLAVWCVLGGLLNLFGFVHVFSLWAILVVGVILAALDLRRAAHNKRLFQEKINWTAEHYMSLGFIVFSALLCAFLICFAVPEHSFNLHDDFHCYLLRPTRMLATGSLGGNPFDYLGIDCFGTQAFLQSFFLTMGNTSSVVFFDPVFCFFLCLLLFEEMARKFKMPWTISGPLFLLLLVINPQYVNLTSIYSGSLFVMVLARTLVALDTESAKPTLAQNLRSVAPLGLIFATLAGLKFSFAFFAFFVFMAYAFTLFYKSYPKRSALLHIFSTVLVAAFSILPWILLMLDNYIGALRLGGKHGQSSSTFSLFGGDLTLLLGLRESLYGGARWEYAFFILVLAFVAFVGFVSLKRIKNKEMGIPMVLASALLVSGILAFVLNGLMQDPNTAIRYSCPVLIGMMTSVMFITGYQHSNTDSRNWLAWILVILTFVVALNFIDETQDRIERFLKKRTFLSFSVDQEYLSYTCWATSRTGQVTMRRAQFATAPDDTLAVLASIPFQLDFKRNKVLPIIPYGLVLNPWLDLPDNDEPLTVEKFLCSYAVDKVIWQHHGFGMRSAIELQTRIKLATGLGQRFAVNHLRFQTSLERLRKIRSRYFDDSQVTVFQLECAETVSQSP